MDTQTQIDRLIELAIVQRAELKKLVSELPQLREHLNAEIERVFESTEPQLRTELEDWTTKQAHDQTVKLGGELEARIVALSKSLEATTQTRYNAIMAERAENLNLLAKAEARIEDAAAMLSGAVKEIVTDELARFPRAGEIDQLRKEFAEPRGLNPRGRWQAGETYNKLDLVSYNGDSYVSNTDGNREKPSRSSEAWTLSAARGNGGAGGVISSLTDLVAVPSNGQLLIGNGSAFVNNTITAGTGVTVTNGPGTITIDASVAQEILTATVTNAESFAITRGQVVYLFGATGNRASVKLANNATDAESSKTFGVVSEASIAAGGNGLVTCVGTVDKLTLGSYTEGDVLYLGATPGSMTATKPYAPNHLVYVGIVERANNGNGELYVRIQNGFELDEIHDVQITTPPLAGALLMRDATNSLWKANRLTGTANQVTVTNADTSVTLSLPTALASVNSITASASTALTLTGGSTGASLVLGQGASGNLTASRTGNSAFVPSFSNTTSGSAASMSLSLVGGSKQSYIHQISEGFTTSGPYVAGSLVIQYPTADNLIFSAAVEAARLTTNRNLLIGTTTDMTGSGGLKIAGTTAATTTTSGALIVAGGVGVSGAIYNGSNIVSTGSFITSATGAALQLTGANPSIEIGAAGSANSPLIDFHSSASSTDYDARIVASGGTASAGAGTLSLTAATINVPGTTPASSSIVGALTIGNGTAAINVAIGAGSMIAGANVQAIGNINVGIVGSDFNAGRVNIVAGSDTVPGLSFGGTNYGFGILEKTDGNLHFARRSGSATNTTWLSVGRDTGAATFAGAVTIAGTVIHTLSATPASASATGTVGTMSWDASYIYICTAANTWKRVAIATW